VGKHPLHLLNRERERERERERREGYKDSESEVREVRDSEWEGGREKGREEPSRRED
jgi:hypothetical protein